MVCCYGKPSRLTASLIEFWDVRGRESKRGILRVSVALVGRPEVSRQQEEIKTASGRLFFFAFLLKFCVVMTTLGSTWIELCLKPWANQCAFPMEMSSLNYVNELCSCLEIYLSSRFVTIALWLRMTHFVPMLSQSVCCGWGVWCNPLSFEAFPFSN